MNLQIRSHWKIAFRSLRKAIKVTISVIIQSIKSFKYIHLNEERLLERRHKTKKFYEYVAEKELEQQHKY